MRFAHWIMGLLLLAPASAAAETGRPLVLELFTSQGCSSCPVADDLLISFAQDSSILALSLHVDYWDYLGWKDPFASEANTARQTVYKEVNGGHLYTPQMIVDGAASAIGSNQSQIRRAIAFARKQPTHVPVTLTPDSGGKQLQVQVGSAKDSTGAYIPATATVYAMQFTPYHKTTVRAGENRGRSIENINNVTRITTLGSWDKSGSRFAIPLEGVGSDGIAVIVQAEKQGRIIGAARYQPGKQ